MLAGTVEHGDSLGNRGSLGAGDIQWMTAGSGILHQEMPKGDPQGRMHGFQLWANLPSSLKMTAPRYQDVQGKDVPEVIDDDGTAVRIVCGSFGARRDRSMAWRPIRATSISRCRPACASVSPSRRLDTHSRTSSPAPVSSATRPRRARFRPISSASGGETRPDFIGNRSLVLFDRGDEVVVQAGDEGIRFLLVSGKPIEEPVAWYGPIVMNTQQELQRRDGRAESRNVHQVVGATQASPHSDDTSCTHRNALVYASGSVAL